jgi:hypothetical protein
MILHSTTTSNFNRNSSSSSSVIISIIFQYFLVLVLGFSVVANTKSKVGSQVGTTTVIQYIYIQYKIHHQAGRVSRGAWAATTVATAIHLVFLPAFFISFHAVSPIKHIFVNVDVNTHARASLINRGQKAAIFIEVMDDHSHHSVANHRAQHLPRLDGFGDDGLPVGHVFLRLDVRRIDSFQADFYLLEAIINFL